MDPSNKSTPLVDAYRRRLKIDSDIPLPPTLETLKLLTELHLHHIPFENLSLHMKGEIEPPIVLTLPQLMQKVFDKQRGGCCLELNGLFSFLLQDLHYPSVTLVPCFVFAGKERGHRNKRPRFRAVPSHFMILVQVVTNHALPNQQYLVDVGLGEPALSPLRYGKDSLDKPQVTEEGMKSRIIADPQGAWTDRHGETRRCYILEWWVENEATGNWEPRLQWDERDAPVSVDTKTHKRYTLQHFHYVIPILSSPRSSFCRKNISCVLTRTTKVSLSGRQLRCTSPRFGPSRTQTIDYLDLDESVTLMLWDRFGIQLQKNEQLILSKSTDMIHAHLWDHL